MMKNRKHDHIGLASNNAKKAAQWYIDVLGFETYGGCTAPDGTEILFLTNGELNYEIFQPVQGVAPEREGMVDHISYVSEDIAKDYAYCVDQGYEVTTDGIEGIPTAWEQGCRYFKIKGPDQEEVEFNQIL